MTSDNILNLIITLFNLSISFFTLFRVTNKEKQLLRYNYELEKSKLKIKIYEEIINQLSNIDLDPIEYIYVHEDFKDLDNSSCKNIISDYKKLRKLFFNYMFIFNKKEQNSLSTLIKNVDLKVSEYNLGTGDPIVINEYTYYDITPSIINYKYEAIHDIYKAFKNKISDFMESDLFKDFK